MSNWLRSKIRLFKAAWNAPSIVAAYSERIARSEADAKSARATAETLRNTLTGIALDVSVFKDSGKIIVLARCQGGDLCKIIDIPQGLTLKDQLRMCDELRERFGVRSPPAWVAAPWGYRDFIEQEMERIWEKP